MMPTVFLHSGAPKTGTSYLQMLFARHTDQLAAQGLLYPHNAFVAGAREGRITSGNGVEMANYIRPGLPHKIPDKAAFLPRFDRMLAEAEGQDLLFSSEFLFFQPNGRTDAIVECLRRHGYDARAIYLVRDIATAARSTYSQEVKRSGEARTFQDFLTTWDPQYRAHIALLNRAFGAANVQVFNYEEHKDRLADLVFGDVLGRSIAVAPSQVINRSLESKELEFLRIFNSFSGAASAATCKVVSDALMTLPPPASDDFALTPDEHQILHSRFAGDLETVNAQVTGRKIRLADQVRPVDRTVELTDFERFTMATLAQLAQLVRR